LLKEYTCIICPNSCDLEVTLENNKIISIEGAMCPKGKTYMENELVNPMRTIATSIKIENGELPLVSVRLDKEIPKGKIFPVMEEIKKIRLKAPVKVGQIVIENILNLGSNVIITKNINEI